MFASTMGPSATANLILAEIICHKVLFSTALRANKIGPEQKKSST